MARARTATLNWVKPTHGQQLLEPVSGVQGSKVRVFARSDWTRQAPTRFAVWERAFCGWLTRALKLRHPATHLVVRDPPVGKCSTSEGWTVSPSGFPGQGEYYFEDEEPKRNRSGTITVTTAKVGVTVTSVKVGGELKATPDGIETPLAGSVRRDTTINHEISAVVDPEATVQLLLPWGEPEHDLGGVLADWVDSRGLNEALIDAATEIGGGPPGDMRAALEAVSDGFFVSAGGWEITLSGGSSVGRDDWREQAVSIGEGESANIAVNVHPPSGGGRTCYALRVIDDEGQAIVGGVVELDLTDQE